MADKTHIEWADATWSPITGCSAVSPGCANCYAARLAATRLKHHPSREGLAVATGKNYAWTGELRFNEQWLDQPRRWKKPRRIFVNAHSDTFHGNVESTWIKNIFKVIRDCPQHTFQVLTKRPQNMYAALFRVQQFPPNVWFGTSVENQKCAKERIPHLIDIPDITRFLSIEPLLEKVVLKDEWMKDIHWVIVGGESGRGARPMNPDWVRSLRDQCVEANVPFFFKQWGEWFPRDQWEDNPELLLPHDCDCVDGHSLVILEDHTIMHRVGTKAAGNLLDGREWKEFPK